MDALRAEVIVIGAGPAGSAAAIELARRGRDVVVAEAAPGPRDRVCGEFVSGEALPLLRRLGALDGIRGHHPALVTRARFTAPGTAAEFELPRHGHVDSLGVRRSVLDEELLRRAIDAGARVLRATRFRAPLRHPGGIAGAGLEGPSGPLQVSAPLLVAADGRASPVARTLGLDLPPRRRGRLAVKAHFRPAGPQGEIGGTVEVHLFPGGYVGIGPVEDGLVNVSAVIDAALARRLGGGPAELLLRAASRSAAARRRLAGLRPASRPVSLYPLDRRRRKVAGDGFLLAGDAARVVPPFTGDGISAALRSGVLAAEACDAALARGDFSLASLSAYARARRDALDAAARAARGLESLVHRPVLARPILALLGGSPSLARALVRATRVAV